MRTVHGRTVLLEIGVEVGRVVGDGRCGRIEYGRSVFVVSEHVEHADRLVEEDLLGVA